MIKIKNVEIENFRSIVGKPLVISPEDLSVIVGPNNCGKSNILRALQLFFTGFVEGEEYTFDKDYPKNSSKNSKSQSKITVTIQYDPKKETNIKKALDELEAGSDQIKLDDDLIRLRLSYSKNGVESWQFIGRKGSKNIKKELIYKVKESVRQSVVFKYIPVGRDSLTSITNEISSELIKTIFSGWSGAVKKRQVINDSITDLLSKLSPELKSSSSSVTGSIRKVFSEIEKLELKLPFQNLEEMLPNLTPVISDTAETGLNSKGAGIQTSSLLFLLKYLADNHPQRHNARVTFFWAIEEPESFLHPRKQKSMAKMLKDFSNEVQTIITTHCAHFIPRSKHKCAVYVVDKDTTKPWSTMIIGDEYELARQTLGVSLLDSMSLFPLNLIVEGPSDEVILAGALREISADVGLNAEDVKFFPAGNASSATYLFESVKNFSDDSTDVKLILDGDQAGKKALHQLTGRAKRDGLQWINNHDYFQLKHDIESMLSERVKSLLYDERPSQISMTKNIHDEITDFKVHDGNKRACAKRAIELSKKEDFKEFQILFNKISKSFV